jgi:hypothetical protein
VWEGPANIQALELLRLLTPKYAGAAQYERKVRSIIDALPSALSGLRSALDSRLKGDLAAITLVTADQGAAERYARKLLERLSRSLALALMCESAAHSYAAGDHRQWLTAARYHEELEAPGLGQEDRRLSGAAFEVLEDEEVLEHV